MEAIVTHRPTSQQGHMQGEAQRIRNQFSPALDVSNMAPHPPTAACEISSYGNVQINRRSCLGVSSSHSDGVSTAGGASVVASAHSRLSSQAGDRNGGSNIGEDDIASVVFGSNVSSNRRLGLSQQESRTGPMTSPNSGSCNLWGLLGPRTSVPGLSGVRFAVDVVQQHRWVLAVAMEGLQADCTHDHYFSVPAGLPVLDAIPSACLPSRRPKVACDFLVPPDWSSTLSLSCVAILQPSNTTRSAEEGGGEGAAAGGGARQRGGTPRNSAVRSSVEMSRRGKKGSSFFCTPVARPPLMSHSFDPACDSFQNTPLSQYSQFTVSPYRAWFVPGSGPSFPPSYFIQFKGTLRLPASRRSGETPVSVLLTLEARHEQARPTSWKAIRLSVQVSNAAAAASRQTLEEREELESSLISSSSSSLSSSPCLHSRSPSSISSSTASSGGASSSVVGGHRRQASFWGGLARSLSSADRRGQEGGQAAGGAAGGERDRGVRRSSSVASRGRGL